MRVECLDHGFVSLVDVMGDDQSIVQAARVSIGNQPRVNEDAALIRYLYRHRHTTPFEMVEYKFHCKMPIFVARQWIRHRTASVNEVSGRYSTLPTEFYVPAPEHVQYQAEKNKQGRSEKQLDAPDEIRAAFEAGAENSFKDYNAFLELGVAKELARINLPLSAYTEWFWKIDLHNLLHFLHLRLDTHAQYEIRVFAEAMAKMVKECNPLAWAAFEDYRLNAVTFSAIELRALKTLIGTMPNASAGDWTSKREHEEFEAKLKKAGLLA